MLLAYEVGISAVTALLAGGSAVPINTLEPLLSPYLLAEAAFLCPIFGAALGGCKAAMKRTAIFGRF